jgi:hypothetical protein
MIDTSATDTEGRIEYQSTRNAYRTQVDENEEASGAVVRLVAAVTDRDVLDLPPLHYVVDTDGFNTLVDGMHADREDVRLEFEYVGCFVTTFGDGTIEATPPSVGSRD